MAEDITLLREQVERCRGILGKLSSLQDEDAGPLDQLTLRLLIGPHDSIPLERNAEAALEALGKRVLRRVGQAE